MALGGDFLVKNLYLQKALNPYTFNANLVFSSIFMGNSQVLRRGLNMKSLIYKMGVLLKMGNEPLWASVFVTFVLVCITAYYAIETRRIRIDAVKPIFTLRTGFPVKEEPMELYLMNNGGVATDVNIDVTIDNQIKNKYHVASIPNDGYVNLGVSLKECREGKNKIIVKVDYKGSYGLSKKQEPLVLEFKEFTEGGRNVKYYYTSIENKLITINNTLTELLNKL